jgi:hypothetical protein
VALLLEKIKKTHIVGENFVLPTALKMCEIVKIAELLRLILASGDII